MIESIPAPKREHHTFASLVQGREDEFPTLAAASRCTVPADTAYIEWENDARLEGNYTQIFRHPYTDPVPQGSRLSDDDVDTLPTSPEGAHGEALTKFLAAVEVVLVYGTPSRCLVGGAPLTTCGGVRHYLGRYLVIGDRIRLRPLTEPMLRVYEHDFETRAALDSPRYEWLCETSLEVASQ